MDWVFIRPKSYLYQEMSPYSFELFIPCQDPSSNKKMEVIRAISDKLRHLSLEECKQINTMIDNIG